ncbi:ABC transporter permease [Roseitranquillus sediminis]|uniref:ABC transporter permease n=1 Tax=Roseitranquillus sediminis TaxID=2809051 RepID=UPI001D0C6CC3|nr:ABC transporter permease subunit [Roseitranquillus sediminis]MBM9595390.1 ABC transporter permease subunit [Roseitranquillus sediminis]
MIDATLARLTASGRLGSVNGILLVFAGWELSARALSGAFLLASPTEVLAYLAQNPGLMGRALAATLAEAAAGFVIGNLAAMALALIVILTPRLERTIAALALLVFCLPLVATGPILRVLFGPGVGPQVTLAALAVYYTTFVPLLVGLRAAPATWFDVIRSYGRGRWTELVQVRAAAALPYLVAGLQIAAPAAILGAMVGEFTGAERGLGVLTIRAMRGLDVPGTWSLATLAAGVSVAAYAGVGWIGRQLSSGPPPVILAAPVSPGGAVGPRRVAGGFAHLALIAVLVLALWTGLMDLFGLNPFFAKRPDDVWRFLVTAPQAAEHRATLFWALAETMAVTLPGYFAGLALGALIAAAIVLVPPIAAVAMPVAVALRSVPIVTTAPLIILLLGRGALGTITLVAVMIFFPTFVACLHGLRQAPGQVIDVFDSYASSRLQRLMLAQVPAMLPAFFAAARMAVPAAILAATVVEWLATGIGVGSLMALSASLSDYGMLWSAVAVVSLTACTLYAGVARLERAVLAVYASEQFA